MPATLAAVWLAIASACDAKIASDVGRATRTTKCVM